MSEPTTGIKPDSGQAQQRTSRGGRFRPGATTFLLCLAAASIAASLVAFALYRPTPPSLAVAAAPSEAQLVAEELTDSRSVELSARLGEEASLASPASGTVTRSNCVAGESLASGTRTFIIDRTPLVNLHTETPLWRDLTFGTTGEDVAALQRELARLGYDVAESERFDWQTWVAWDALVEQVGGDTVYGELALSQVVWLPTTEIAVAACPIGLGQAITQGSPLVTLASPLLSASVKNIPIDLVPGARKLSVGDVDVAIDDDGQVTAEGLTALSGTEEFARFAQNPKDSTLQAELVLTEPVTVYPVPPAAVAMNSDTTGCVTPRSGPPIPVTIVSSKLGRSYITFETAPDAVAVEIPAPKGLTCS